MKSRGVKIAIAVAVGVIVAALAAYALVMVSSVNRAMNSYGQARESFQLAKESVEKWDFASAYASTRKALDSLSELSDNLAEPQWDIAAFLPILGSDVRTARELAAINGKLVDEAVLPILDQLESQANAGLLVDAIGALTGSDRGTQALSGRIEELKNKVDQSTSVVYECEDRLSTLPDSHFDQLDEAVNTCREAVTTAAALLRTCEKIIT